MITQDIYKAAYLKARGAELGLVKKSSNGMADIHIIARPEKIQQWIHDYETGGVVSAKLLFGELNFIRHLVNKKCS